MKTFALTILLTCSVANAANVCDFQDTYTFTEKVEAGEVEQLSVSEGEDFSSAESAMIFTMMKKYSEGWRHYENEYQAVFDFLDYDRYNDREQVPGTNAGNITYFKVGATKVALVHFWPGDNEYGSIFEQQRNGSYKHIAKVSDGEINCFTK